MTTSRTPRAKINPPALLPGDTIEYSLTAEIHHPTKGTWWIKSGGTTTIREGETETKAKVRLRTSVHTTLDEAAGDILNS